MRSLGKALGVAEPPGVVAIRREGKQPRILSRVARLAVAISVLVGTMPGLGFCAGTVDAEREFARSESDFSLYVDSFYVAALREPSDGTANIEVPMLHQLGPLGLDPGPDRESVIPPYLFAANTMAPTASGQSVPLSREQAVEGKGNSGAGCYWTYTILSPIAGGLSGMGIGCIYLAARYLRVGDDVPRPEPDTFRDTMMISGIIGSGIGLVVGQVWAWTACR